MDDACATVFPNSSGNDWSRAMNFHNDQVKPGPWIWGREFAKSPSVRYSTCWFRGGAPCEPHGSFWGGGGARARFGPHRGFNAMGCCFVPAVLPKWGLLKSHKNQKWLRGAVICKQNFSRITDSQSVSFTICLPPPKLVRSENHGQKRKDTKHV